MRADDSDRDLVLAARGGDMGAFARLLVRHRPLLLALCRRTLGDGALAEDAAQEAALQALSRLDSLRRAERFGPWLAGIGLNVCRMWLRARSREGRSWETLGAGRAAGHGDPEAHSEAADLAARVRRAVGELPAGQRAAVQLYYLADLTYAETAAELGIEVGAVRTRLHKARGTLRRQLWEVGKEEHMKEEHMTTEDKDKVYSCSFCSKKHTEVRRLIAGPNGVFICNECVALCNEIIAEAEAKPASK